MVRERYSTFRAPPGTSERDDRGYLECVRGAFRWIISIGRTAEPNTRLSYDMLCDRCLQHLRAVNAAPPAMPYGAVMAAAIACGDIPYDDPVTSPFPWCYLGINPDVPSHAYAGTYKQILDGARDFLPPIMKGQSPRPVVRSAG
jgi:hypothetical protein